MSENGQADYERLIQRFREVVCGAIPPNSTVLIVSKGDHELLNLENRRGCHFPQREDGVYAGYYPTDSAAAIAHLESLRAKGAQFLVFPAPTFWWLSYYSEFTQYLQSHYRVVLREDEICLAFSLTETAAPTHAGSTQNTPDALPVFRAPPRLNAYQIPESAQSVLRNYVDEELIDDLSVVFNPSFYSEQSGITFSSFEGAFLHYLEIGADKGFDPHPLFDTRYYSSTYPAVKNSGANALLHFLVHSVMGGHNPHPLFDTEYYYSQDGQLRDKGVNALVHYLTNRPNGQHEPNPLFSNSYYLNMYRDVREGKRNPLAHYVQHGCEEWRFASPVHHSMIASLLRATKHSLRRSNWTNGTALLCCSGNDQPETAMLLECARKLVRNYRLSCLVLVMRRNALVDKLDDSGRALVLEDYQLACDIFRPSAIRLLLSSLRAMKPFFAVCDSEEWSEPLAANHIPYFYLYPEIASFYPKRSLQRIFDRATRVLFDHSFDFQIASKKLGAAPTKVGLRLRPRLTRDLLDHVCSSCNSELNHELGLANDCFIVLGGDRRRHGEGCELFHQVTDKLRVRRPELNVAFVWYTSNKTELQPSENAVVMENTEIANSQIGNPCECQDNVNANLDATATNGSRGVIYEVDGRASLESCVASADVIFCPRGDMETSELIPQAARAGLPVICLDDSPSAMGSDARPWSQNSQIQCLADADDACDLIIHLSEMKAQRRAEAVKADVGRPSLDQYVSSFMALAKRDFNLPETISISSEKKAGRPSRTIIIPCCDWGVSGVNSSLEEIGCELIRLGWDVQIVFTRDRATILESAGGENHLPRIPYRFLDPWTPGLEGTWEALISDLENHGPCIMFMAYDFVANGIAPALSENVGVVTWLQADDGDYYEQAYRLGRYCNAVVCVSDHIKKQLANLNPLIAEKAEVIHNASVKEHQIANGKPTRSDLLTLVYTGRLVQYQKRVLDFVELARGLDQTGIQYQLTLIGEYKAHEDIRDEFERRAKSHLEAGKIIIKEKMGRTKLLEELSNHDLFVLLSDFEGLPLSLIEAMARGCVPVVAAMDSGVPEVVVGGENGLIVTGRNYHDWGKRISELWLNKPTLTRLAKNARETIRRQFTVDQVGKQFDALFTRVAESIHSGSYCRPPCLNWGENKSVTGDVLAPPSLLRLPLQNVRRRR